MPIGHEHRNIQDRIRDDMVSGGGGGGGGGHLSGGSVPPGDIEARLNVLLGSRVHSYAWKWRLLVLVFGRPGNATFKEQIEPHLDYWHFRSGSRFDFLCVGYGDDEASFDNRVFADSVTWLQSRSAFRYSGQTDLVLLNAQLDRTSNALALDTGSVVVVAVEDAITDGAFRSTPSFMERICTFVEGYEGDDPTWGFSDAQAATLGASGLKALLLAALPKSLRKEARAAFHLRVREYRRSA